MKDYRSLWKKPHLVAAVMAGTAGVLAAENRYDLQADIELEDGTVVYSSPVLEPDSHIDTVDLDEELEDGTYPAQARLFAVDPESGVIVGYVLQPIELRVGNAD